MSCETVCVAKGFHWLKIILPLSFVLVFAITNKESLPCALEGVAMLNQAIANKKQHFKALKFYFLNKRVLIASSKVLIPAKLLINLVEL